MESDQEKGLPIPDIQKPYPENAILIDLVPPEVNFLSAKYLCLTPSIVAEVTGSTLTEYLNQEEISFLLWSTQGVKDIGSPGIENAAYGSFRGRDASL